MGDVRFLVHARIRRAARARIDAARRRSRDQLKGDDVPQLDEPTGDAR